MRRLPHSATLLRPSTVTDGYGDEVDGDLAPVGSPFPAWLQQRTTSEDGEVTTSTHRLHVFTTAPAMSEKDVVEIDGVRYRVEGDPYSPVNPRGRGRLRHLDLNRVTRGG